ncbi:hypothetical protein GQR58_004933 [Nymphon striatum]|nr:hypothetical protein GQR58_004933 [Nymphon striatum]
MEAGVYSRCYSTLFSGTGMLHDNRGNGITYDDYKKGFMLYSFDLSPDLCESDHFNLRKNGSIRIEAHFKKALPHTVNLVAYAEYENILEIDNARNTDTGRLLVKEIAFLKYDFVQCYLIRAPPDQRFNRKTLNYLAGRHGFRPKDGEHDYKHLKQLIDTYCKGTIAIVNGEEKCKLLRDYHNPTINAADLGISTWNTINIGSEDCCFSRY